MAAKHKTKPAVEKQSKPKPKYKPRKVKPGQLIREGKIGRNDPCPCGSELKYKKCCWVKENERMAKQREDIQKLRNLMDSSKEEVKT